MKRLTLLFVMSIATLTAVAQNTDDELSVMLLNFEQSSNTEHLDAANRLMKYFADEEWVDSLYVFDRTTPNDTVCAWIYYLSSEYYFASGQFASAVRTGELAARHLADSDHLSMRSDCLGVLSLAYTRLSNFTRAIELSRQCYEIDNAQGDKERMSSDLNNLAAIYLSARHPDMAEQYILKGIDIEKTLNRPAVMAVRYGVASEIFIKSGKNNEALDYAHRAYLLDVENGSPDMRLGIRLSQIAGAYIAMGEMSIALDTLDRAIPLIESGGSRTSLVIAYTQMGEALLAQGQRTKAVDYLDRALALAMETGNRMHQLKAHRLLWKALRDYAPLQAMSHLEQVSSISDSIYNSETSMLLAETESFYKNTELKDENAQLTTANRLLLTSAIAIGLLLVFAIVLIVHNYRLSRRNTRLHKRIQNLSVSFFTEITNEFHTPLAAIIGLGNDLQNATANSIQQVHEAAAAIVGQGDYLLQLINQQNQVASQQYDVKDPNSLRLQITQLLAEWQQMREKYLRRNRGLGSPMTYELTADDRQWLNKLIDYVHQQMRDGVVKLDSIAAYMGMSRSSLNRRVQRLTGENAVTYIMQVRLSHAKRLLDSSERLPVGEVAMKCGFDDVAYFSRIFHKMYGMSPSQFRRRVN